MNKQVEYDEFREILKAGFFEEVASPLYRWQNMVPSDPVSPNDFLTPETFASSEVSDPALRDACRPLRGR